MAGLKKLLGMMPKSGALSAKQPHSQATTSKPNGMDSLGGFVSQLKNGAIKPNLNQPALPHTASGRLNLIG